MMNNEIFPDYKIIPKPNKLFLLLVSAFLIALFYFSLFTEKDNFGTNQIIIWGFGPLVSLFAVILYLSKSFQLPKEGKHLIYFLLACLLGLLVVENVDDFMRYYRLLMTEFVMFIVIIVAIYTHRGEFFVITALFIAAALAVFNSYLTTDYNEAIFAENVDRESGIFKNSNGFAVWARYGIISGIFLMVNFKNIIFRLIILGIIGLCIYSVVAAGSRGNIVTVLLIIVGSIVLLNAKENKVFMIVALIIIGLGVQFFIGVILPETSLGRRVERVSETGIEEEARYIIILNNLEIWWRSPLFGVGLKQLQANESVMSHNEPVEILASTGILGFGIYYSIYYFIYRRLRKISAYYEDKDKVKWKNIQVLWVLFLNHLAFLPFDVSFVNPLSFTYLCVLIALSFYYERNMDFQIDQKLKAIREKTYTNKGMLRLAQ